MIVDVSGCSDQEWYLVHIQYIDGQDDLLIVVPYVLQYRDCVWLHSSFYFLTVFPFRPRILGPKMVCIILISLGVVEMFFSWFFAQ